MKKQKIKLKCTIWIEEGIAKTGVWLGTKVDHDGIFITETTLIALYIQKNTLLTKVSRKWHSLKKIGNTIIHGNA